MTSLRLKVIPRADLTKLRDLLLQDWPKHVVGYHTVDNFVRWYEQDPDYPDATIYCLDGDWSDGTYVILVS